MNIVFDWDGTIARPDVAKEASLRRFKTLGASIDPKWLKDALKNNDHYANKRLISEYTGIVSDNELTTIMTDIFRFHYAAVIHEWMDDALYPGMRDVIISLHKKGHRLAIASTLRQDLLDYSLINLGLEKYFVKVYANTPDLKYSKQQLVLMAKKHLAKINYMIGDKKEDLDAGHIAGAKSVLASWGVTGLDHKAIADIVLDKPKELLKALK